MNNSTHGEILQKYRNKMDWSQDDLSLKTGIHQARISMLETGKRQPSRREWKLFEEHLKMPAFAPPDTEKLPYPNPSWRVSPPDRWWRGDVPVSSRLYRACESFGTIAERLLRQLQERADASMCMRFLDHACLDSTDETVLWMHGFGAGGRPCWSALSKAGFRKHRVVDKSKKLTISDIRQPCLEVIRAAASFLLFPQVWIDTRRAVYRLDALVCVKIGSRRHWVNAEVDGGGHNSEFDHRRQANLDLPTVRFTRSDLERPDFIALFEKRLLAVLDDTTEAA